MSDGPGVNPPRPKATHRKPLRLSEDDEEQVLRADIGLSERASSGEDLAALTPKGARRE